MGNLCAIPPRSPIHDRKRLQMACPADKIRQREYSLLPLSLLDRARSLRPHRKRTPDASHPSYHIQPVRVRYLAESLITITTPN